MQISNRLQNKALKSLRRAILKTTRNFFDHVISLGIVNSGKVERFAYYGLPEAVVAIFVTRFLTVNSAQPIVCLSFHVTY